MSQIEYVFDSDMRKIVSRIIDLFGSLYIRKTIKKTILAAKFDHIRT